MSLHREVKRRARQQLHERLADEVFYLTASNSPRLGAKVRLQLANQELGELLRGGFSDMHEATPKAVFMLSAVQPARGGIIVTKDMGAWRVDNTLPPHDITMAAEIVKITAAEITRLGWNGDAPWMGLGTPVPGETVPAPPPPEPTP